LHRSHLAEDAVSPVLGIILNIAIVLILAMLVLLMFHIPTLYGDDGGIPAIFIITSVESIDDYTGRMNYDSRVIILHTGQLNYENRNLSANFYKNGIPVRCNIESFHGADVTGSIHSGIQWMGGPGCSGDLWTPNERTKIDFTDGTFRPGDSIRMDIIDKKTDSVISRHTFVYT
jgi:hypothetical protein